MSDILQSIPSPMKIREELERMVFADLHGPVGGEAEEIDEPSIRERRRQRFQTPVVFRPCGIPPLHCSKPSLHFGKEHIVLTRPQFAHRRLDRFCLRG